MELRHYLPFPFYDVMPPRRVSPWRQTMTQPPPASSWTSNTWGSVTILPPFYNPTIETTSLPALGATGTRRNPFGSNYPSLIERIDIDLTVCKTDITSLETQAIQQASKLEWMQQELRIAREDREEMTETINELKNQVLELTNKIETGAALLKTLNDVCTF